MTAALDVLRNSAEVVSTAMSDPLMSSRALLGRRNLIVDLLRTVMKEGIHYGTIPGTPKPTLYKPGAELIFSMFRISAEPLDVKDLSVRGYDNTLVEVTYQVTIGAKNQITGAFLGAAVGICSSSEEKYLWRKPVCNEELDEAPADQKREVWKRVKGTAEKIRQIRTSPADVANTIMQMASKRAFIATCRLVTAASDVFTQGVEELPEEIRASIVEEDSPGDRPQMQRPARKSESQPGEPPKQNAGDAKMPAGLRVVSAKVAKETPTWTLWSFKTSDGNEHVTFSKSVYDNAVKAMNQNSPITYEVETTQKGDQVVLLEILS